MFSGAEKPRPNINSPLEFTWMTAKFLNKQHVRKNVCPTEMLWVELIMFFQPQYNIKQSRNRKGQIQKLFWSWNSKGNRGRHFRFSLGGARLYKKISPPPQYFFLGFGPLFIFSTS